MAIKPAPGVVDAVSSSSCLAPSYPLTDKICPSNGSDWEFMFFPYAQACGVTTVEYERIVFRSMTLTWQLQEDFENINCAQVTANYKRSVNRWPGQLNFVPVLTIRAAFTVTPGKFGESLRAKCRAYRGCRHSEHGDSLVATVGLLVWCLISETED